MNIGVFIECKDGGIRKTSLELLSKAKEVDSEIHAIALGANMDEIAVKLTPYAHKVIIVDHPDLKEYGWDTYTGVLSSLITKYDLQVIFGASTVTGKDLFPRLSARLKTAIITDAVDIASDLKVKKPLYGGRVISWASFTLPALITFRPNSFPIHEGELQGEIIKEDIPVLKDTRLTVTASHKDTVLKVDLQEADFIISGGRGMKGPEHFALLEEIASLMNGRVGASRAAVDSKWRDYDDQVGKSGKTVSPKIYIGCGISGALHHTMGMDTSKTIIAINKDPTAPIFQCADYGIVDDLFSVLPLLKEELAKAKE